VSKKWFILQFKPNSHKQAVRNLNQQGFETFLPMYDLTISENSRFRNITKPLFSGYMFVAFDKTNSQWNKINNTYGVSRLVTFNSTLKSVPAKLINSLRNRCDVSGKLISAEKLSIGDQVKLLNGPFINFVATVETLEADQRTWILLDLMGRKTKIKTFLNNLELSQ
jgi:transcriptional antiterminator RfaH